MALINRRYSRYYNTKYGLTGPVFELRYKDKIIEEKEGMLEVSRYIHQNAFKGQNGQGSRTLSVEQLLFI